MSDKYETFECGCVRVRKCSEHDVAQLQQERDSLRLRVFDRDGEIERLKQERDSARARLEKFAGMLTAKDADLAELTEERDRQAAVNRRLREAGWDAFRLMDVVLAFGEGFGGADMPSVNKIQQKLKSALAGLEDGK